MLSTRKIGQYYYVRGTVRVGKQTIKVKEHSTGFIKSKDAASYVSKLEDEIRQSVLNPNSDKSSKVSFGECLEYYLNNKKPKYGELVKINIILPYFESAKIDEIHQKWNEFRQKKCNISQSTSNRYASIINAVINYSSDYLNIEYKPIKLVPIKNKVVFLLNDDVRDKLLSCYSKHSKPIFTVMAYQGFREQECLQLLWEDIRLHDATIIIRTSKNGETRSVPMHKKTWWILSRIWLKSKCPVSGHVFLNRKRKAYTDTRKGNGGTPIRKSHTNALEKLQKNYGIKLKMRIHDWRHDWAGRMVMAGVDLLTVQKLGGWKSISMVGRYATFSKKHESDAINKI